MNFESKVAIAVEQLKSAVDNANRVCSKMKEAADFTVKFLEECRVSGITKVSICREHKSIPETKTFPFGCSNSVFAVGKRKDDGWPPIWGIVERLGIGVGCGNGDQHQIDDSNLIDGVYHLKNGKWAKVA